MAKTLMGAVFGAGKLDVKYQYTLTEGGAVRQAGQDADWSPNVMTAAAALLAAAGAEVSGLGAVAQVQIYTPITDQTGYPGFSERGELVDIYMAPRVSPNSVRMGDNEVVPAPLAAARDALKAAILADLNPA